MSDAKHGLSGRIDNYGAAVVERGGWAWSSGMRRAAEALDAVEVSELADVVEAALAADGAYGLVDLAADGSALGGLGERDLERLLAVIDDRASVAA